MTPHECPECNDTKIQHLKNSGDWKAGPAGIGRDGVHRGCPRCWPELIGPVYDRVPNAAERDQEHAKGAKEP